MANEATAALSDAYGHVMHGDDAGSSARVVWVVHPTRVAVDLSSNRPSDGRVDKGNRADTNKMKTVEETESPGGRRYGYTQKFGEFLIVSCFLC